MADSCVRRIRHGQALSHRRAAVAGLACRIGAGLGCAPGATLAAVGAHVEAGQQKTQPAGGRGRPGQPSHALREEGEHARGGLAHVHMRIGAVGGGEVELIDRRRVGVQVEARRHRNVPARGVAHGLHQRALGRRLAVDDCGAVRRQVHRIEPRAPRLVFFPPPAAHQQTDDENGGCHAEDP